MPDGYTCSRCGGLTETLIDLDSTGRTRVRFRCGDCGLTANTVRAAAVGPARAGGEVGG